MRDVAEAILIFDQLPVEEQERVLEILRSMSDDE